MSRDDKFVIGAAAVCVGCVLWALKFPESTIGIVVRWIYEVVL